jgi:hypothetical protein
MKRAEELRDYLNKQSELDKNGGGGAAMKSKDSKEDDDADAEKKKLRGALSGAIVTEKPDVKWTDVAGLEQAKESLKEVSTTWDVDSTCFNGSFIDKMFHSIRSLMSTLSISAHPSCFFFDRL